MTSLMPFLHPQQREAFDMLTKSEGGCVFWMMGEGKTRVALAVQYVLTKRTTPVAVIVVCRRPAFDDWRTEIATLQFDWDVEEVENVDARKALKRDTFVLCSDGKLLNQITVATLQQLVRFQQAKGLIIDEGYLFANPQTIRHKAIRTLSCKVPTVLLSGSIMSRRDLAQVYGQVAAAGKALCVAPSLTRFRTIYQTGIGGAGTFYQWYPKPGAYKALMQKIAPFTHVYFPKKNKAAIKESTLKIQPSPRQLAYFKELKETFAVEGVVEFNSATTLVIKCQQISNGWLKGESGIIEIPSPKIDRLVALVEELLAAEQRCVIWCAFRYDIDRLFPILSRLKGCNVATFRSGENFDSTGWHANKYNVCLATEASGSSVNHFAQVPYGIYFSQDYKWLSLEQSKGRHTRRSSRHETAYFYFLHTEKSMDARIYHTVQIAGHSEKSFIREMDVQQWLKEAA